MPAMLAWGVVSGVALVSGGLTVPQALAMTLLVYSAGAQLGALSLMLAHAPLWLIAATAACVNLRFVIFSAQWRPYFGGLPRWQRMLRGYLSADLNFVVFMSRFPEPRPAPGQGPYFWGGVATNWPAWQLPSLAGMLLADAIPTEWGFGFAGILALLGLMYSLLTDRASWVAAGVACAAAVATVALPLKLNVVVAIAAAVAIGLLMNHVTPAVATPVKDNT